jgi:hypothetical protein
LKDRQSTTVIPDQILKYRVLKPLAGSPVSVASLETALGGKITSVTIHQESGTGKISGDTADTWDLSAGSVMAMGGGNGQSTNILSNDIIFLNVSGVMRMGVTFKKTGSSVSDTSQISHTFDATSVAVDSSGNVINLV